MKVCQKCWLRGRQLSRKQLERRSLPSLIQLEIRGPSAAPATCSATEGQPVVKGLTAAIELLVQVTLKRERKGAGPRVGAAAADPRRRNLPEAWFGT
jgi:hypothetical protein